MVFIYGKVISIKLLRLEICYNFYDFEQMSHCPTPEN